MRRKKIDPTTQTAEAPVVASVATEQAVQEPSHAEVEQAQAKLDAKVEARKEILKDLGITEAQVQAKKQQVAAKKVMVEVDLGRESVRINGVRYTGKVIVSSATADVLVELASKRRERAVREAVSRDRTVKAILQGNITRRVIEQ